MPARDIYHDAVKNALIQEGWIITDDPLHLKWGQKDIRTYALIQNTKYVFFEKPDMS